MEILILLLMILGIGICAYIRHIKVGIPAEDGAQGLILEAAAVTADFLEAGQVVSILSEGNYLGTISVRLQHRKYNRAQYVITMYDSGNLQLSFAAYKEKNPELFCEEPENFRVLEKFLEAYGGCYDRERNALVYVTKHSAGYGAALEGEAELKNRIALHPLAEMESLSRIHTKYVGKP